METAATVVAAARATQAALGVLAALQLTAPLFPPREPLPGNASYDYVVVGAGSAGAVLATRLAELRGASVLLVEAGGDPPLESVMPGLMAYIPGSRSDWNYTSSGDERVTRCHGERSMRLTRGRMLGGCSSANYMAYVRGAARDYDAWAAAAGDAAWSYERLLPYFKRSERLEDAAVLASPAGALHGTAGCVGVARQPRPSVPEYLRAFREAGHATPLDVTGPEPLGYAQPLYTLAGGVRQSTAHAFLSPRARCGGPPPNLHVLRDTLVTRVLLDERAAAVGVEAVGEDGRVVTIAARREVVLSAGAINSPQLLMLSGVGPAERLEALGVRVRVDLPRVGRGLQDHPSVVLALAARRSAGPPAPPPPPDPARFPGDLFLGFAALDARQTHPDYETENFVMPAGSSGALQFCAFTCGLSAELCDALQAASEARERDTLLTVLTALRPASRGRVELRSAEPRAAPRVRLGYYDEPADLERMVDYIEHFLRVLDAPSMRGVRAAVARPALPECGCEAGAGGEGPAAARAYWRCYVRCASTTQYHYAGTCALGAVVDARLRVRGARRLRVADASVMPVITSGNTNAPAIMIGERAADFIKEDWPALGY